MLGSPALERPSRARRRSRLAPIALGILGGAFSGTLSGYGVARLERHGIVRKGAAEARQMLPSTIILVRHGESEGNADEKVYQRKGDNLLELTDRGSEQAVTAGERIKRIIGDARVHLYVSPWQRTLQTARNIYTVLGEQVINITEDPRIREREYGNLQNGGFKQLRVQQKTIGRFWYRFPQGESAADVYDRTTEWWNSMLLTHVLQQSDAEVVVVVTHGLAMRLILMQLFHWSPTTFHSMRNPTNCCMYVLRKCTSVQGAWRYELDELAGDKVTSSIDLLVQFRNGVTSTLRLVNYLSVPEPRTSQVEVVTRMLAEQHGIDPAEVQSIDFFGGRFKKFM